MMEYLIDLSILIGLSTFIVVAFYPVLFPPTAEFDNYIKCVELSSLIASAANNQSSGLPMFLNSSINVSNGVILIQSQNYQNICKAPATTANESGYANQISAYLKGGVVHLVFLNFTYSTAVMPSMITWKGFPGNVNASLSGNGLYEYLGNFPGNYTLNLLSYSLPKGEYYLILKNNTYIESKVMVIVEI